jgi:two-component system chemotaxis sensor kinase CheA
MDAAKVDRLLDAVGEAVLHHRRVEHALGDSDALPDDLLGRGDVLLSELQDSVIRLRTLPLVAITGPFPRAVRDLATSSGKQADLVVEGAETQLDRMILEGAAEAIGHLLRNAVAHGLEAPDERRAARKPEVGRVTLRAEQRGDRVAITVADDGRGVARELLLRTGDGRPLADVMAEPGLSTADAVTDLSGRGVGLDAVRGWVDGIGGEVEVATEPGRGTEVTLLLPLSIAMVQVLLVERGGIPIGIPLLAVDEVVALDRSLALRGRRVVEVGGATLPLVDLVAALGGASGPLPERAEAVVVSAGGRRVALACDRAIGDDEVVVRSLGPLLAGVPGYLGAGILRDGRVALIAEPAHVAAATAPVEDVATPAEREPGIAAATILVVDDQFTVRELQRSILEAAGYRVVTANDGSEARELLFGGEPVDLVVTDIEMPEVDGFELLDSIRRMPDRSSLPVVIVTSRSREEDERRGLDAGADAYIVKERFDQRVLLDTVQRLLAQ